MLECAFHAAFLKYAFYNTELVSHYKTAVIYALLICEHRTNVAISAATIKYVNNLLNADFVKLEDIKESKPLNIICFVFLVELSNDYSLSQKVEKLVSVLIDLDTGETIGNIRVDDLVNLDMKIWDKSISLDEKQYRYYMNIARQEAYETIKNQLEVFKKEIEGTLKDKISSIINKYEDEYIDNYTKTTLNNLNKLQEEALKLCEREIRGYL